MAEFEREEAAFRVAFQRHAEEASSEVLKPRRRRGGIRPALVAALVLGVVGGTFAVLRSSETEPDQVAAAAYWDRHDWRWIGVRDVEVKAPAGWAPEYEVSSPECLRVPADGPVPPDLVPVQLTDPYVAIGDPDIPVPLVLCTREAAAEEPPGEFGALPFALWQPYVKVTGARPDLAAQRPEYRDGASTFRGWRLLRQTVRGVQISVLSAPGDDDLGPAVLNSVRTVEVTDLGCRPDAAPFALREADIDSPALPDAAETRAVTVCEYVRYPDGEGLGASRQITGQEAQDLVSTIRDAPSGRGPDSGACLTDQPVDRVLVLLFFAAGDPVDRPSAGAYVFFDSCTGNGIRGAGGEHELTRALCAPLFAEPPIGIFAGDGAVVPRCHSRDPRLPPVG